MAIRIFDRRAEAVALEAAQEPRVEVREQRRRLVDLREQALQMVGALPALVRKPIAGIARRRVIKTMELHGLGKHSLQEQKGFARRDLEALAAAVPAEGVLFAEKPNIYDFTVAAMMAGIYDNQPATWVTDLAVEYENLRVYTERVQAAVGVWGRE